jgi:hypothetical protein
VVYNRGLCLHTAQSPLIILLNIPRFLTTLKCGGLGFFIWCLVSMLLRMLDIPQSPGMIDPFYGLFTHNITAPIPIAAKARGSPLAIKK